MTDPLWMWRTDTGAILILRGSDAEKAAERKALEAHAKLPMTDQIINPCRKWYTS